MHIVPTIERTDQGLAVSSETIAEGAGVQHKNVLEMIGKNTADLETFGRVAFETRTLQTAGGAQQTRVALLNEQQSTLLMTYLRNTEQVKRFKVALVQGFYEMAQKLASPALTDDEIIHRALQIQTSKIQALESKVEADAPKVEAYDTFIDADGTYSVGNVAKMLGRSQNKLFTELRNIGVLIAKGHMRNTPRQEYMKHFTVKAYSYTRSDGNEGTSYTTRVQPSGINFIRRKLELPEMEMIA